MTESEVVTEQARANAAKVRIATLTAQVVVLEDF